MTQLNRLLTVLFCSIWGLTALYAQEPAEAEKSPITYLYAEKDGQKLYLDYYPPAKSALSEGEQKPTILFAFGGGFLRGSRDRDLYTSWFHKASKEGYRVVSTYHLYKVDGAKHGVANMMDVLWEHQELFFEKVVNEGEVWSIDATLYNRNDDTIHNSL